jgi:hypothetical protein
MSQHLLNLSNSTYLEEYLEVLRPWHLCIVIVVNFHHATAAMKMML